MRPWEPVRLPNGQRVSANTRALIADAAKAAGVPLPRVVQGSWSHGSLSAGTHAGAGAFDLSVRGIPTRLREPFVVALRARGVAAWLRDAEHGGMDPHIHGIVAHEPGLSSAARRQVAAYRAGRDGLAGNGRDYHPRPAAAPFVVGRKPTRVGAGEAVLLRNLVCGSRSDDVKDLQRALHIVPVDGFYGPQVDAAVRAHQRRIGLRPDPAGRSFVGPKQARALRLVVAT